MKMLLRVGAVMVVGVLSTAQAQVLDQSQEVMNGGISVNNLEHTAQGFVQGPNLSYLAEIWVYDVVHAGDTYPVDLTLEIRNGAANPPPLMIAHTEDFTLTGAPADTWHKFVFGVPVGLTSENPYTFLLKGAAGNTGTTVLGLNKDPSYGGTELMLSTKNGAGPWSAPGGFQYDLTFRTYSRVDFLPLVIDQATLQDSTSLCFTGEVGKVYNLQSTTDMVNTQGWEDVGAAVPGNGGVTYLFDPTEPTGSLTSRVYRIIGN